MIIAPRPISEPDKDQILRWRNAPHVAEYMYTNHEISPEEHDKWFARALSREDAEWLVRKPLIEAKLSRRWPLSEKLD